MQQVELTRSLRAARISRARWRELFSKPSLIFLLFVSPWILGFLIFTVWPMLTSFYYSFTKYKVIIPPRWIGLENYKWLFTMDLDFKDALANSLLLTITTVPVGVITAFIMAVVVNQEGIRGLPFWRALFYIPAIIPAVASIYMFAWVLNYYYSPLNLLLKAVGLQPVNFFASSTTLILLNVLAAWGFGGGMIIFLAGLRGIPRSLYEAASIDGANRLQQIRHITLPGLSPVFFFMLTGGLIGSMQAFQTGWFLIQYGAPRAKMIFLGTLVYTNAFGGGSVGSAGGMGYASAVAWVIFAIVMVLTALNLWGARYWVYYEQI